MKRTMLVLLLFMAATAWIWGAAITVTSPASKEVWCRGNTYTIRWNRKGKMDSRVKIRLFQEVTQILAITDSTNNDGAYDWTVPKSIAPGTYKIRVKTLDNAVSDDSDKFTIPAVCLAPASNPDIVVNDIRMSHHETGGRFPISVTLRNNGGTSTNTFQVKVEYTRNNPPFATPTYTQYFEASLGAYSTQEWTTNILLESEKRYTVKVTADSGYAVTETNEKNNGLTKIVSSKQFDLKVKNVTRHRNNKPDVHIKFKVKNVGHQTSPSYRIYYTFSPRSGNQGTYQSFFSGTYAGLNPDLVRQHVISNQLPPGKWKMGIMVHPDASENNLTNNFDHKNYKKPL